MSAPLLPHSTRLLPTAPILGLILATGSVLAQNSTPAPSAPASEQMELTEQPADIRRTPRLNESAVATSSGYQYRTDVGYATDSLLDMQRNAHGERARHIDAEQARRSYQRYLKSFDTAIPEKFDTGLDVKK
ncbi:putative membrane-bound mannosyltransferase [Comamonas odontotermitis]|uniref:Membrane-bound mannosyltransferase n=1 Tax=Comamonas odontotermitis TaxID=379895 RepID=A0ABR6RIG2_9BURK|nr:DUF3613 domain-containing protein [Comamonas odontotermitis]MBB6578863.1 putative membrane-bound mannosyltransferase [Comamonas odontotermitis]